MKSYDEIVDAIRLVAQEAGAAGFTFCAAVVPPPPRATNNFITGEPLKIIGLCAVMSAKAVEHSKVHSK